MSKPLQVGITGCIGAGKSFVCKLFSKVGIPTYDADTRAKWVMNNDQILKESLIREFGNLAYDTGGLINRNYISDIVFNDKSRLQILNKIVHPRVGVDYTNWVVVHQDYHYIIKEAALLYESGSYKVLDKIINISAPEELRIQRILARDGHRTEEDIRKIIAEQMSDEEKSQRADFVIYNDGKQMLLPQVIKLHTIFMEMNK